MKTPSNYEDYELHDEISTIQIFHELKKRQYPVDTKAIINKAVLRSLSEKISSK
ncbi:hypothetical protein [Desulfonema magnum]|uniref:Uncharacterized protein n=1 Tax=Desulfonema magnum TaxID=45655 RepID=A0A975GPM1_9BACT|nr:hypothetical protein [Desulfonema magnum]QTA88979.1 Uncharacterized protein dnm_050240 [Desulfonema magnum]